MYNCSKMMYKFKNYCRKAITYSNNNISVLELLVKYNIINNSNIIIYNNNIIY